MRTFFHTLVFVSLTAISGLGIAHPNDSIVPEQPLATPYGLNIQRAGAPPARHLDAPEPLPDGAVDRYLQSIHEAELSGGAYSAQLPETLLGLGRASQAAQQHEQAIAHLKRALHLLRINEGLYSANQLPVLASLIKSQMALGRMEDVDRTRNYRYRAQRHVYRPGEPELQEATLEYSDWQREAYLNGLGEDMYKRLLDIHTMHSRTIEQLEAAEGDSPAVIPVLYQRMRAEYLLAQYPGEPQPMLQISANVRGVSNGPNTNLAQEQFRQLRENNFRNGRRSLERIVGLLEQRQPPDMEGIARAKVALGDWYMWWNQKSRALHSYEQAYALRTSDGRPVAETLALFREPVELPVEKIFHSAEFNSGKTDRARVVVRFNVSRLGRARDIEIVELEPPDSMGAKVTLYHMLRALRFRPIVRDGELVATQGLLREYQFRF